MLAVLLPVGDDLFAVPADVTREVIPWPALTPLPTAPPSVLGAFAHRGDVVTVFDTATLLGLTERGDPTHAALVVTGRGLGALAVTGVPVAATLGAALGESGLAAGRGRFEAGLRVATLLDVDAVLSPIPER